MICGCAHSRRLRLMAPAFVMLLLLHVAHADDLAALCADRTAIEYVYYLHRTGTRPPFSQAMPPSLVEKLVLADLKKESALSLVYGMKITPAMVAAEVRRIETTTRAPEVLAEIKTALGGDPARFARSMARPILVERELRQRFDNDDRLHAAGRRTAEQVRAKLLAGKPVPEMQEVTWQLTPRSAASAPPHPPAPATAKSGSYAVEATVQLAPPSAAPGTPAGTRDQFLFEDLDPQLRHVLSAQLRQPGDVSAVIEMPSGFLVFQAKEKTGLVLTAARFSLPKRSYEEWLAQLPGS